MKLSKIFEEKPERWGFRGDPYFWDHLKKLAENMDMITPEELEKWIKEEYFSLSGKTLTDTYMDFAVIEQFKHGCEIRKLYPEWNAEARFKISGTKYLLYYCNQHGLFKAPAAPSRKT